MNETSRQKARERNKRYKQRLKLLGKPPKLSKEQKEKDNLRKRLYYKTPEYKQWRSQYRKNKMESDPQYNIMTRLRSRLQVAIKRHMVGKKLNTVQLLGCSIDDFIKYIESKFQSLFY
jgi:DNA polymerase II small subunit/DNA polymerase delta subunit B